MSLSSILLQPGDENNFIQPVSGSWKQLNVANTQSTEINTRSIRIIDSIQCDSQNVLNSVAGSQYITVNSADPINPVVDVINVVKTIVPGTNITVDDTDPENPIVSSTGGGGVGSNLFTIVDVDITAADLAGGATKVIWTPPDSSTYIVLQSAIVIDQCVDFDAGGDRDLDINFSVVDGELAQIISASVLKNLSTSVPNLNSFAAGLTQNTINQPDNIIRAVYSTGGGSNDYTSGNLHLRYWLLDTNATAIGGSDNIVYVKDISVTAADLASGGQVTILDNTDPAGQYEVITTYVNPFGTNFSGGGGDRDVIITDGISQYAFLSSAGLSNVAGVSYPYVESYTGLIGLPVTNSVSIASQPGANLYAEYINGASDFTDGEFFISMVLRKIAGNNSVGVQEVVAGTGVTVNNTNPQRPIVSVNASTASSAVLKDNGTAGEIFCLANRSDGFGLYKSVIKPFEFYTTSGPTNVAGDQAVYGCCVDSSDNFYVCGQFYDTLTLGAITVTTTTPGIYDCFLAKLTSGGTWDWIKTGTSAVGENCTAVSVATDNTYIWLLTNYQTMIDFDGSGPSAAGRNFCVFQLNMDGTYFADFTTSGTLNTNVESSSLKLLSNGDPVISFNLNLSVDTLNFGTIPIAGATAARVGITRIDVGSGLFDWVTLNTFTGDGNAQNRQFTCLTVDSSDNIYTTGSFNSGTGNATDTVTMGSTLTLNDGNQVRCFISKMNSTGTWQWALTDESVTNTQNSEFTGVVVDGSTVYVSGSCDSDAQFGTSTIINNSTPIIVTSTTAGVWNSAIVEYGGFTGSFQQLKINNSKLFASWVALNGSVTPYQVFLQDNSGLAKFALDGTIESNFNFEFESFAPVFDFNSSNEPLHASGIYTGSQIQFQPNFLSDYTANFIVIRLPANLNTYSTTSQLAVLLQSGNLGDTVEFAIFGSQNVFSGLTAGNIYTWDVDTETFTTLTNESWYYNVGYALSANTILIFNPLQRYGDNWNFILN